MKLLLLKALNVFSLACLRQGVNICSPDLLDLGMSTVHEPISFTEQVVLKLLIISRDLASFLHLSKW